MKYIKYFLFASAMCLGLEAAKLQHKEPKALGVGPHTYDYLLGESDDLSSPYDIIFLDYDLPKEKIQELKDEGKTVICYVNVGAWEEWRSDADDFPESVLGSDYEGWEGERWLDIREIDILMEIMIPRFEKAEAKGCEGIDPDNMNGYQQEDSGFPLTKTQQLAYNRAVSGAIRDVGMLAGLKNDGEQAGNLLDDFDFVVSESCAAYDECTDYHVFLDDDKPVFAVEYTEEMSEDEFWDNVCPDGEETGISYILKDLDLHNDYIVSCFDEKSGHKSRRKASKSFSAGGEAARRKKNRAARRRAQMIAAKNTLKYPPARPL